MKVINLDRFKNVQTVELEGAEYEVRGITVDMMLNDPIVGKLDTAVGKERINIVVEVLTKLSSIPEELLKKQSLGMLTALMAVVQGNDPNENLTAEESEKVPNE